MTNDYYKGWIWGVRNHHFCYHLRVVDQCSVRAVCLGKVQISKTGDPSTGGVMETTQITATFFIRFFLAKKCNNKQPCCADHLNFQPCSVWDLYRLPVIILIQPWLFCLMSRSTHRCLQQDLAGQSHGVAGPASRLHLWGSTQRRSQQFSRRELHSQQRKRSRRPSWRNWVLQMENFFWRFFFFAFLSAKLTSFFGFLMNSFCKWSWNCVDVSNSEAFGVRLILTSLHHATQAVIWKRVPTLSNFWMFLVRPSRGWVLYWLCWKRS